MPTGCHQNDVHNLQSSELVCSIQDVLQCLSRNEVVTNIPRMGNKKKMKYMNKETSMSHYLYSIFCNQSNFLKIGIYVGRNINL